MRKLIKSVNKNANKLVAVAGTGLATFGQTALAALDTSATGPTATALTAAQTSGENVGAMVIGVVAGLVVIGIIITLVKKA